VRIQRGFIFGMIMVAALAAFELFNFSTTEYALNDLLGGAEVLGVGWASVLAVAFCAIDFAGLARLFTPEQGRDEPKEVWYLMGAWFLGAAANAALTWWAVSLTLLPRPLGNEILSRDQLLTYVPIFVAVLVWITRVLVIGTFGVAGERVFTLGSREQSRASRSQSRSSRSYYNRPQQLNARTANSSYNRSYQYRSAAPRTSAQSGYRAAEEEDEELVYEPVEQERPKTSYSPPPRNSSRGYSYTRPAPKPTGAPSASYGYSAQSWNSGNGVRGYYAAPKTGASLNGSWVYSAQTDEDKEN
jgi:hypothetical protein